MREEPTRTPSACGEEGDTGRIVDDRIYDLEATAADAGVAGGGGVTWRGLQ